MNFYISDHHFGHANIINLVKRDFKNLNHMHESMIESWNQKVKAEDNVYYVGDFAGKDIDLVKTIVSKLNGNIIFILGNHDPKKSQMKKAGFTVHTSLEIFIKDKKVLLNHYPFLDPSLTHIAKRHPNYLNIIKHNKTKPYGEEELQKAIDDYAYGKTLLLKYYDFPIHPQDKKTLAVFKKLLKRFVQNRPINKGQILLHGHSHKRAKIRNNAVNLSVEAWNYIPASEDEIYELIKDL